MKPAFSAVILVVAAFAACDAPSTHRAVAAPANTAPQAAPNALIPGTPPGDLDAWVREIRAGIAALPAAVAQDPAAAQRTALDLYVTRQEYLEMYYGVDGRLKQSEELAAAVETAEERFHELLKLFTTPQPATAPIQAAVDALDQQQAEVVRLWQAGSARLPRKAP